MRTTITRLTIAIIFLATLCTVIGIFYSTDHGSKTHITVYGDPIETYGKGLYKNDSVSGASQMIAQDIVTLVLGIPLLIVALVWLQRSFRGLVLMTGTLGYLLYTYASYAFMATYNSLFLLYVLLMTGSLFGFILCIAWISRINHNECFVEKIPARFVGGFMLFIAATLCLMWLGRIIPSLLSGAAPEGLELYTTLVIQALDLGIIVPASIFAGVLTLRRRPLGYLVASILVMKGISMLTAISMMIFVMSLNGVSVSSVEMIVFPMFNLVAIICFVLIVKNIKEPAYYLQMSHAWSIIDTTSSLDTHV